MPSQMPKSSSNNKRDPTAEFLARERQALDALNPAGREATPPQGSSGESLDIAGRLVLDASLPFDGDSSMDIDSTHDTHAALSSSMDVDHHRRRESLKIAYAPNITRLPTPLPL